jgi:predicted DNA-binding protein
MPTPSNNYKPFMTYLAPAEYAKLKKFSSKTKTPMTQIIREAVTARISEGNAYVEGFNAGLQEAINAVNAMKHAQMRFPSGKSFAELVADDLIVRRMKEVQDETGKPEESMSGV